MNDIDPSQIGPEEFARLVTTAPDDQIEQVIHAVGTERTLTRIFQGFEERFVAARAQGVAADVQFVIKEGKDEYPFVVAIKDGTCTTSGEQAADPKTTLALDLLPFVKLVTGRADGVKLFMTRKLKISGDLMFAQRVMTFFDRPGGD